MRELVRQVLCEVRSRYGIAALHALLELYLPPGPGLRDALPDQPIIL
jgi:hypothetical protein